MGMRAERGSPGPKRKCQRWLEGQRYTQTRPSELETVTLLYRERHGGGRCAHSRCLLSLSQEEAGTGRPCRETGTRTVPARGCGGRLAAPHRDGAPWGCPHGPDRKGEAELRLSSAEERQEPASRPHERKRTCGRHWQEWEVGR